MVLSALGFSAMQLCSSLCADIPAMEQVFFRNVMAVALYALVWEKGRPPPRHAARAAVSHRLEPLRLPERRVPLHRGQGRRPGQPHDNRPHERLPRRRARGRILKERVTATQYAAVILAIAGGAMTASPSGTLGSQPLVLTMAVLSSLFNALASLFLGLMKNRVHALTVAMPLLGAEHRLSAPFLAGDFVLPDAGEWLAIAGIGLFGGLGQLTQMWAYERAPVGEVNIYGYSGILFSLALGLAFLGERPALPAWPAARWSSRRGYGAILPSGKTIRPPRRQRRNEN